MGSLEGFSAEERISRADYKDMPELERYMLHKLAEMDKFVRDCIDNYEFGKLAKEGNTMIIPTDLFAYSTIRARPMTDSLS